MPFLSPNQQRQSLQCFDCLAVQQMIDISYAADWPTAANLMQQHVVAA